MRKLARSVVEFTPDNDIERLATDPRFQMAIAEIMRDSIDPM